MANARRFFQESWLKEKDAKGVSLSDWLTRCSYGVDKGKQFPTRDSKVNEYVYCKYCEKQMKARKSDLINGYDAPLFRKAVIMTIRDLGTANGHDIPRNSKF